MQIPQAAQGVHRQDGRTGRLRAQQVLHRTVKEGRAPGRSGKAAERAGRHGPGDQEAAEGDAGPLLSCLLGLREEESRPHPCTGAHRRDKRVRAGAAGCLRRGFGQEDTLPLLLCARHQERGP